MDITREPVSNMDGVIRNMTAAGWQLIGRVEDRLDPRNQTTFTSDIKADYTYWRLRGKAALATVCWIAEKSAQTNTWRVVCYDKILVSVLPDILTNNQTEIFVAWLESLAFPRPGSIMMHGAGVHYSDAEWGLYPDGLTDNTGAMIPEAITGIFGGFARLTPYLREKLFAGGVIYPQRYEGTRQVALSDVTMERFPAASINAMSDQPCYLPWEHETK